MRVNDRELIRLEGVRKEYGGAGGVRDGNFLALRDVGLTVFRGEYLGVIGKSGSGKTTLLNMITGIDRPTSGAIWFGGERIDGLGESDLARFRGRSVGVVFQFFQLMPTLSVLENVMLPMDFLGAVPPRDRRERAESLLERIGIADQMRKLPQSLSGGQQQRAAIARALANDPALLVADEPTGNLDTATADSIWDLFARLVGEGKTLVIVSHDPDLTSRVTRSITIRDGIVEGGRHAS